jgi:ornithine decarboxylase
VSALLSERSHELELPEHWPGALGPEVLRRIDHATPFSVCDLDTVRDRYRRLGTALPGFECFYALKCNPATEVVQTLAQLGSSFEIASLGELRIVQSLGVEPADVIYSNTVKPAAHVAAAHEAGVWRFAFDGEGELHKLAEHAPGSAVFIRLRVDDTTSIFPLSRKFGASASDAHQLLVTARNLGLRPYGVTFHVGSQCTSASAWRQALAGTGRLLSTLKEDGIELEMLNLSGGFPARYTEPVPTLGEIAGAIWPALNALLPYVPPKLAVEPGRFLVAESAVVAAGVIGREMRAGENWVYLDVGAYNGLIETRQATHWTYPLWTSRPDHTDAPQEVFTVTGPTCDSSDTLFPSVRLPASLGVGDVLYIGSAGAYTLSYGSSFNGFAPPAALFVGAL